MQQKQWIAVGVIVYFGLVSWWLRSNMWQVVGWLIGGVLSLVFLMVDRLVHVYLTRPEEQLSVYVRYLVKEHRYTEVWRTLRMRGDEQRFLMSRSVVFMVAFIPLSIYVLSSTGSLVAIGLLMGVGLQLLILVLSLWRQPTQLKQWLFWPIKRVVSNTEMWVVIGIFGAVFGWLTLTLGA